MILNGPGEACEVLRMDACLSAPGGLDMIRAVSAAWDLFALSSDSEIRRIDSDDALKSVRSDPTPEKRSQQPCLLTPASPDGVEPKALCNTLA